MPSSGKTSIGLNLWEVWDHPKSVDFNSDNQIIDNEILSINSSLSDVSSQLSQSRKAFSISRLYGSTTAGSPSYTFSGIYTQIGNIVFMRFHLVLTSKGGMAGNVVLSGFPVIPVVNASGTLGGVGGLNMGENVYLSGFSISGDDSLYFKTTSSSQRGNLQAAQITDSFAAYDCSVWFFAR